jgi:hypothetical protein
LIDDRIYSHPSHSELSKAVMLLHEYIYLSVRLLFDDQDSREVRKLIAYVTRKAPAYTDIELGDFVMRTWGKKLLGTIPGAVAEDALRTGSEVQLYLFLADLESKFSGYAASEERWKRAEIKAALEKSVSTMSSFGDERIDSLTGVWHTLYPDDRRNLKLNWASQAEQERWKKIILSEAIPSLVDFYMDGAQLSGNARSETDKFLSCYSRTDERREGACVRWRSSWIRKIAPATLIPSLD